MTATESVLELLKQADAALFPPVDSAGLVNLLQRVRQDLKLEPPPDYMAFLRQSDGAIADGLMLYGCQSRQVDSAEMPALIDINLSRRAYRDDLAHLLQLGEIDDDIVGFDQQDQLYWRIDRSSGECQATAVDLRSLVSQLTRAA